jgi:hypothetical protein
MIRNPIFLIILGFFLLLFGWVMPLLMLMHVLPSTFFLNFFSYIVSLVGLILGVVGVAFYVRLRK